MVFEKALKRLLFPFDEKSFFEGDPNESLFEDYLNARILDMQKQFIQQYLDNYDRKFSLTLPFLIYLWIFLLNLKYIENLDDFCYFLFRYVIHKNDLENRIPTYLIKQYAQYFRKFITSFKFLLANGNLYNVYSKHNQFFKRITLQEFFVVLFNELLTEVLGNKLDTDLIASHYWECVSKFADFTSISFLDYIQIFMIHFLKHQAKFLSSVDYNEFVSYFVGTKQTSYYASIVKKLLDGQYDTDVEKFIDFANVYLQLPFERKFNFDIDASSLPAISNIFYNALEYYKYYLQLQYDESFTIYLTDKLNLSIDSNIYASKINNDFHFKYLQSHFTFNRELFQRIISRYKELLTTKFIENLADYGAKAIASAYYNTLMEMFQNPHVSQLLEKYKINVKIFTRKIKEYLYSIYRNKFLALLANSISLDTFISFLETGNRQFLQQYKKAIERIDKLINEIDISFYEFDVIKELSDLLSGFQKVKFENEAKSYAYYFDLSQYNNTFIYNKNNFWKHYRSQLVAFLRKHLYQFITYLDFIFTMYYFFTHNFKNFAENITRQLINHINYFLDVFIKQFPNEYHDFIHMLFEAVLDKTFPIYGYQFKLYFTWLALSSFFFDLPTYKNKSFLQFLIYDDYTKPVNIRDVIYASIARKIPVVCQSLDVSQIQYVFNKAFLVQLYIDELLKNDNVFYYTNNEKYKIYPMLRKIFVNKDAYLSQIDNQVIYRWRQAGYSLEYFSSREFANLETVYDFSKWKKIFGIFMHNISILDLFPDYTYLDVIDNKYYLKPKILTLLDIIQIIEYQTYLSTLIPEALIIYNLSLTEQIRILPNSFKYFIKDPTILYNDKFFASLHQKCDKTYLASFIDVESLNALCDSDFEFWYLLSYIPYHSYIFARYLNIDEIVDKFFISTLKYKIKDMYKTKLIPNTFYDFLINAFVNLNP